MRRFTPEIIKNWLFEVAYFSFNKNNNFSVDVQPTGKVVEDVEVVAKIRPSNQPPEMADQLKLINDLRTEPKIGFRYMIYAVERSSEFFTPYALK